MRCCRLRHGIVATWMAFLLSCGGGEGDGNPADVLIAVETGCPFDPGSSAIRLHMEKIGGFGGPCLSVEKGPPNVVFASYGAVIYSLDVTVPDDPKILDSYSTAGKIHKLRYRDGRLYVGNLRNGLLVLDASDVRRLRFLGHLKTKGIVSQLQVAGNLAFLPASDLGIVEIADVSDPRNPKALGSFEARQARAVDVQGALAYVIGQNLVMEAGQERTRSWLWIWDVTVPTSPVHLWNGIVSWSNLALDVVARGSYVYVAARGGGVVVFDVSKPTAPRVMVSHALAFGQPLVAQGLAFEGEVAYVACVPAGGALAAVDMSDPAHPKNLWLAPIGPDNSNQVALQNGFAYVANDDLGMQRVDLARGRVSDRMFLPSSVAFGIALDGPYAYIADYNSGLQIADISDPAHPVQVGTWLRPDYRTARPPKEMSWRSVDVQDGIAYLAMGALGLRILDVRDPRVPREIGSYVAKEGLIWARVRGKHAFVAGGLSLRAVDISQPESPMEAGSLTFASSRAPSQICLERNRAYVSGGTIFIVDVERPEAMRILGEYDGGWRAASVFARDRRIYAGFYDGSLRIIDAVDPAHPVLLGSVNPIEPQGSDRIRTIYVEDNLAYVGYEKNNGLRVIDVSKPSAPLVVGGYDNDEPVMGLEARNSVVFAVAGDTGLWVVPLCREHQE